METYKKAFDELYEGITATDDEALRLHALNIKERLLTDKATQPAPKKATVSKEEFDAMGYTERVKFKAEYPEQYATMAGGK